MEAEQEFLSARILKNAEERTRIYGEISDPLAHTVATGQVEINTEKCPLFISKLVKNVTIKESPEFIQKRLIAAGMRPINNVVDISNYVMVDHILTLHN